MPKMTGGPSWPEKLRVQEQRASVAERTNLRLVAVLRRIAEEGDSHNGEVSTQARKAGQPESWAACLAAAAVPVSVTADQSENA